MCTKVKTEVQSPYYITDVSVDAVYAAAHAIHNLIETECGTDPFYLCDDLKPAPVGPLLLKYLRNVSFVGKCQNK